MSSFHQRPLTWLFFIATACADAVIPLIKTATLRSDLDYLLTGVLIGQIWLSGAWLALGGAHRLARGAIFVLMMVGLTTLVLMGQNRSVDVEGWGHAFGAVSVMGAATATASWLANLVTLATFKTRQPASRVQFPIIELFGWMIVVAVASWAVSLAQYAHLGSPSDSLLFAVTSSLTAGVALALAMGRRADHLKLRQGLAVAIVLALAAAYAIQGGIRERDLFYGAYWAFGYLGLAALAQTLDARGDERRARIANREGPSDDDH